jgi:anti-anti-sigma factor
MSQIQLRVTVTYHGYGDAVITLAGMLDRGGVGGLEDRLNRLLARGASSVLLDLTDVDRCDCRLLAVLDRIRHQLQATHGQLHIRGLDPDVLSGFAGPDPTAGTGTCGPPPMPPTLPQIRGH